jgi:hypothetical protein
MTNLKAAGTKILVQKGKLPTMTQAGLALPDTFAIEVVIAKVLSVGEQVTKLPDPVEVVIYNGYAQSTAWDDINTRQGYAVIDETAVLLTCTEAEAEREFGVTFGAVAVP